MPKHTLPQSKRTPLAADIIGGAASVLKGLWVTLITFFRPKVTERYPFRDAERNYKPRPGYRGDFALITDRETGNLRCTACMSCAKVCPDKCIHIVAEGKGKERKPAEFYIDVGLCMFCWLCVEACPFDALTMTPDYEQAVDDPRKLVRDIEVLRTRGLEYEDVLRVQTAGVAEDGPAQTDAGEPTQ